MTSPAPIGELFARAGRILARRWPLYLVCTAVAYVVQIAILRSHAIAPIAASLLAASFVAAPATAVVFGFGDADDAGHVAPAAAIWGRIVERLWAVVLIDATLNAFWIGGLLNVGSSFGASLFFQIGFLVLATLLAFSEVHAIAAPGLSARVLVQQSILAGVKIGITRIGYLRAMSLVFALLIVAMFSAGAPIEAGVAATTIAQMLLAALTVVFYRDCLASGRLP